MSPNFATDNPDPKRGGRSCTIVAVGHVLDWSIKSSRPVVMGLIRDLIARDAMGFERYGQNLETRDGRDTLADLYQEVLDALQYATKLKLEEPGGLLDVTDIINTLAKLALKLKAAETRRSYRGTQETP